MRRRFGAQPAFALSVCLALGAACCPALAGSTERVSVSSAGVEANVTSGYDRGPVISADGRFAAFPSDASNLVPDDTNGCRDVFVRDRLTGCTELVSLSTEGVHGNGISDAASVSADGRFVAFHSLANNLASDDTNATWDVFVRDRALQITKRVSIKTTGTQGLDQSLWPQISGDGTHVAFQSLAHLADPDNNPTWDIFVRDIGTGTTECVSVSSTGAAANAVCESAAISEDGRFVAWCSAATTLVPGVTAGFKQIYLRDRLTDQTECVSLTPTGAAGNQDSLGPSISADGSVVAFWSQATDFVPGDSNWQSDIYARDRLAGVTERISLSTADEQPNYWSGAPFISADGRYVAFDSWASNLVAGDGNEVHDCFVRDRVALTTVRVSVNTMGQEGNNHSVWPSISHDGRFIAFRSQASDLVADDTNACDDAFVRDERPAEAWGAIQGLVFEDVNGNGHFEIGEPQCAHVDVTLSDGQVAVTTGEGLYQFTFVGAGAYTVSVSVPRFAPRTMPVVVTDHQVTTLDIPLAKPFLTSSYVTPTSGDTSTQFTYRVKYWNSTQVPPTAVWLAIWSSATQTTTWRQMWQYDPSDTNTADGKWYTCSASLNTGDHAYRFAAEVGPTWVYWPQPAGTYSTGPSVAAGNPVVLSSGYVLPAVGTHATSFSWRVKYWNTGNAAPDEIWCAIWFPTLKTAYWYPMWPYDTADTDYRDGAWYLFSRGWLPAGTYAFRFAARQGSNWAYWPTPAGHYAGGPTVSP